MSENSSKHEHSQSYGSLILVWLSLLVFTGLTVVLAGINLGNITIAAVLIIASIKSLLVLSNFMHLKFEDPVFKIFIAVAVFFLVISLVLMFTDYSNLR